MPTIAQVCRECPNPTLIHAYLDAARQFCNESNWLIATLPGNTVANQRNYSLGSDTYNEIKGIRAISITVGGKAKGLTESVSSTWDPNAAAGIPQRYQYLPEAQFALDQIPSAIYPLTVSIILQPKVGGNSIDESLAVNWEYALRAGALAQLLAIPRMPWSDMKRAVFEEAKFKTAIASAAISAQRGYNSGAIPTNEIGQPSGAISTRVLPI